MSVKCGDVIKAMESYAPSDLAEGWDNVGLMVGSKDFSANKILIALDINDEVIDEAVINKADMIITHHPLIFKPILSITEETPAGRRIRRLIKEGITVFSAHTNLDKAQGGTNDTLLERLGLLNKQGLLTDLDTPRQLALIGELETEMSFADFAEFVKDKLKLSRITIAGNKNRTVKKVSLSTGSGGGIKYIEAAKNNACDVYISGDIKYHDAQYACDLGICLIDATHYATEVIVTQKICGYLSGLGFNCTVSKVNGQTLDII